MKVRGCERPRVTIDGFEIPNPTLTPPVRRQSHCPGVWDVVVFDDSGSRVGCAQGNGGR